MCIRDRRWDVGRVDLEHAGLGAEDAREAKNHRTLPVFALGENLQVLARHLDRLFSAARVFVADHLHLSKEASTDTATIH